MNKKLDITLKVQKPEEDNVSSLDFYITSGEIVVSDKWSHFLPYVLVNGEEFSEYFFENLMVVTDIKEKGWPEGLPFRLIWDSNDKKRLKGITAYYDFLLFRDNKYYPDNGLTIDEAMKQKVHLELKK